MKELIYSHPYWSIALLYLVLGNICYVIYHFVSDKEKQRIPLIDYVFVVGFWPASFILGLVALLLYVLVILKHLIFKKKVVEEVK